MLVVHGVWADGALSLWAEHAPGSATGRGRAYRRAGAVRPHPFAAGSADLAAALGGLPGPVPDLVRKATEHELTLWLPSVPAGPQPSPEMEALAGQAAARGAAPGIPVPATELPATPVPATAAPERLAPEPPAARRTAPPRVRLAAWQVPALAFEPAAAAGLLGSLASPDVGAADVAVPVTAGASLGYLLAVAVLAADLAARGRVLPLLIRQPDGYRAQWGAVLSGADAQRAADLSAAMPPLCRALSRGGEAPAVVLAAALDTLTDVAARERLARGPGSVALPPRRGRSPARIPVAERWAAALLGAQATVAVAGEQDEQEAASLTAALAAWRDSAQLPAGPVRTCFRLVEPDGGPGGGEWRVGFALQSTQDPSLLLGASDIWAGSGGWAVGRISHPDEELLSGLGAAARLFPELDAALRHASPAEVSLDTAGAFRFLKETGPLLSGAGFGVLLPDWARKARLGLKLTTRTRGAGPASVTGAAFSMNDLVDFRYDLAVGDQALDAADLAELARLKIPLVRIRGQWVELDERNLRAALRFMERGGQGSMTAGDALLAGLRGPADDLPVVSVDAGGWLGDLLSGEADRRLDAVGTPAAFDGTLRPYQERGLAWLAFLSGLGLGGILADDMGLGKSIETLALLSHERRAGAAPGPTLLVCPMSLVGNWQREAAKFTPGLRVHVHHGADRLSGDALTAAFGDADLVITTYAIAARDQAELAGVAWARVVCDEAQNIKNPATRQARAVRGLPAGSRIALTGTPVENRLSDLWSIMQFTSPGLLGSAEKFRAAFAIPIERDGDDEAAQRLRRLTRPFILRRVKTDTSIISDLPVKQEMKIWCNLTAEQASLYQATVADMLARVEAAEEGIERRGLVLATMARLKQVCNHPAHLLGDGSRLPGRSGKLARLEEICDEVIADGDKALCFTQYAEFGRMLQPHLAARLGCPVFFLHGGTSRKQRDEMVTGFQGLDEPAVFLLSLKAGGTGLNLTAANHVIHVDRWWNPAVESQATDRAFRIGQRKDVQVRTFVCVGTVEERVDAMIERKKALAERIVGSGEGWLADLSVEDLRTVIELSPDAVSE